MTSGEPSRRPRRSARAPLVTTSVGLRCLELASQPRLEERDARRASSWQLHAAANVVVLGGCVSQQRNAILACDAGSKGPRARRRGALTEPLSQHGKALTPFRRNSLGPLEPEVLRVRAARRRQVRAEALRRLQQPGAQARRQPCGVAPAKSTLQLPRCGRTAARRDGVCSSPGSPACFLAPSWCKGAIARPRRAAEGRTRGADPSTARADRALHAWIEVCGRRRARGMSWRVRKYRRSQDQACEGGLPPATVRQHSVAPPHPRLAARSGNQIDQVEGRGVLELPAA